MDQSKKRLHILIIDKTAGLDSSHERHQSIASIPEIDLHVLGPKHWIENGRDIHWNPPLDTNYHVYRGYVFGKDYYARAGYYSGLLKSIRTAKPDIIQLLEEPWSISALQTLLVARLFAPHTKLLFYTWENIDRGWHYPSRAAILYRLIDQAMHKYAAGALCSTQQAHQVLLNKAFKHPVSVIPYGIPQYFLNHKTVTDHPPAPFTIGYIGRMLDMKGVDMLLHALKTIPDIRLLLAGTGEDEQKFRELSKQLEVEDRIEWTGSVLERDIPALLKRMNILVLPSRTTPGWMEQLGRVLIEAMAVGTPVIGSLSGAIPEIIGDAGLLFTEDDVEDLCQKISRLKSDTTVYNRFIQKGRQRVQSRFTWQRFAQDIHSFYLQLLNG